MDSLSGLLVVPPPARRRVRARLDKAELFYGQKESAVRSGWTIHSRQKQCSHNEKSGVFLQTNDQRSSSPKEGLMRQPRVLVTTFATGFALGVIGVAQIWAQNGVISFWETCTNRAYVMRGEAESASNPRVLLPLPSTTHWQSGACAFRHFDKWPGDCAPEWSLRCPS
jgi:hypothetical protein